MREQIEFIKHRARTDEGWRQNVAAGSLALGLITGAGNAQASGHLKHHHSVQKSYSESQIIDAIVGEASGSGYRGMLAIASVIRNRQHSGEFKYNLLKGVAGLHAKHNANEPSSVFELAQKAWEDSATNNIVPGCTLWGNKSDISKWKANPKLMDLSKLQFVKEIGGNYFYRYR